MTVTSMFIFRLRVGKTFGRNIISGIAMRQMKRI
jgi:hypothetical protein